MSTVNPINTVEMGNRVHEAMASGERRLATRSLPPGEGGKGEPGLTGMVKDVPVRLSLATTTATALGEDVPAFLN